MGPTRTTRPPAGTRVGWEMQMIQAGVTYVGSARHGQRGFAEAAFSMDGTDSTFETEIPNLMVELKRSSDTNVLNFPSAAAPKKRPAASRSKHPTNKKVSQLRPNADVQKAKKRIHSNAYHKAVREGHCSGVASVKGREAVQKWVQNSEEAGRWLLEQTFSFVRPGHGC